MKYSKDIPSESEIEVKEEVENGGTDFNERVDIKIEDQDVKNSKTKTYCLLCQEYGHVINDNCVVNATCFSCGVKGHVRRDCYCLICQEPGHVLNDGCATCFICGVKGHVRRNCPSLLDTNSQISDSGHQRPLSPQTQELNPELEIPDGHNLESPPSLNTVNIIPKNDNIIPKKQREPQSEKQEERVINREMNDFPKIKVNHLTVCSTTLWVGHLSKHVVKENLSVLFGQYGEIISIDLIPPRGCAYVEMKCRTDADKALEKLRTFRLSGKQFKMAWAPGKRVKDMGWKDYFDVDLGAFFVPFDKLDPQVDIAELDRSGLVDEDTMPGWMKNLRGIEENEEWAKTNNEYIEEKDEGENKTEESEKTIESERGRERDRDRRLHKIDAPCKFFLSKGCKFGLICRFQHDNESSSPGRSRSRSSERRNVEQALSEAQELSEAQVGPIDTTTVKSQGQGGSGAYSAEQRQDIVREVVVDLVAPSDLARKYKISAHSIRDWVKKTGQSLPTEYKKSEWGPRPPKFPPSLDTVNILQKNSDRGMERDRDGRLDNLDNQLGLPSEIESNTAPTDATAKKALVGINVAPVDATTSKCREQGGSDRNQEGQPKQECQVCDKIFKSYRTLNNHMKIEHGITYL